MVIAPFDVRRERGLVPAVRADSEVVPPHERERMIGSVVDNCLRLDD